MSKHSWKYKQECLLIVKALGLRRTGTSKASEMGKQPRKGDHSAGWLEEEGTELNHAHIRSKDFPTSGAVLSPLGLRGSPLKPGFRCWPWQETGKA